MFTIGRFAELTGVSAKRLRHYDRLGLFRPAWVDPGTGYRYYSAGQLPELRRIIALIDLGVSLADIADLQDDEADLDRVLARRRDELEQQRAELDRRLQTLDISLHRAGPLDVVVRRLRRERWVSLRRTVAPGSDVADLFDEAEFHVADHDARASRPPALIVHDATTQGRDIEILIPVTRRVPDKGSLRFVVTEADQVATSIVVGGYSALNDITSRLWAWIDSMGLEPTGPARYVYLRFSADDYLTLPPEFLTDRTHELVTEIQVPVGA